MKTTLCLFAMASSVFAQLAPPATPGAADIAPETVVATTGDRKITAGEVNKLIQALPLQMKQGFERDPRGFLSQWFLLQRLLAMAEEKKLDQRSPYKETIAIQRMSALAQFMIEDRGATTVVSEEDLKKSYEARKNDYTMAKVKLIYVPFVAGQAQAVAGSSSMTEAQALAKAEEAVKTARSGADFVKLVAEMSEDPISKEKQGDFGPIRRGDKLPDPIKSAVFSLKPGQVSDPVRQPNGYYIFRLQEMTAQALDEVKDTLFNELKNAKVKEWLDANAKATEVKVEKQEFFAPKGK
ncbi:MAG: peptidyl-prolyl cis-trans isomerase [Acidobacteria bacterium]|nr:peptidyl-prolyl cis-trans isomerase [Acidobacteriota bacterium]